MKKKNWIIAGLTAVGVGATAIAVAMKVRNEREEKNAKHLVVLNDEADQPLQQMEALIEREQEEQLIEDEPIMYHSVVDPLTRNEEIVREVARMELEDDDQPLKSDDELMQETAKEGLRSNSKSNDIKIVTDLLTVYNYLDSTFIIKAIELVENYAQMYDGQKASVNYLIQCADIETVSRYLRIMEEFGYDATVGESENSVEVKTVVEVSYVKLLQDMLTIVNQAYYVKAKLTNYEVLV